MQLMWPDTDTVHYGSQIVSCRRSLVSVHHIDPVRCSHSVHSLRTSRFLRIREEHCRGCASRPRAVWSGPERHGMNVFSSWRWFIPLGPVPRPRGGFMSDCQSRPFSSSYWITSLLPSALMKSKEEMNSERNSQPSSSVSSGNWVRGVNETNAPVRQCFLWSLWKSNPSRGKLCLSSRVPLKH